MAQKLNDAKFVTTNMTNIIANDNQLHSTISCKRHDLYYCIIF
jgi:hypothetical protein